jgi:glycine/D-amino acid oxidase-like deaminating enzyme
MRVAIIGAGATGCAAARFLAKSGHEVDVYEQFTLGHDRGSSHGTSRIIRRTYPDAYYVQLMAEAYPLWYELQAEAGAEIYRESGFLIFGSPNHPWMRDAKKSLLENHVAFWEMGSIEATRKFGGIHMDLDEVAIFQPEAGILLADKVLQAQVQIARAHGARFLENTRANIDETGRIDGERYDAIAICAGPWIGDFVNVGLKAYLQTFAYFEAPVGEVPAWVEASDDLFYGFPNYGRGFKVGRHRYGPEVNPNQMRSLDTEALRQISECAHFRLGAKNDPTETFSCIYTVETSEDFRIGKLDCDVPIYFVSACSGHGFKFTIWFGKLICDMIEGIRNPQEYPKFYVEQ